MQQETKEYLKERSIYYGKRIAAGFVIGGLICLGLSFAPLSPLFMGEIIAVVPAILFALYTWYNWNKSQVKNCQGNQNAINEINDLTITSLFTDIFLKCIIAAPVGVGIAAGCRRSYSWDAMS